MNDTKSVAPETDERFSQGLFRRYWILRLFTEEKLPYILLSPTVLYARTLKYSVFPEENFLYVYEVFAVAVSFLKPLSLPEE